MIIKPQGQSVLRITINMDAKGQIQFQCDVPGAKLPPAVHPITLAQIFSQLATQTINMTVQALQQGNRPSATPQEGGSNGENASKIITD